MRPVFEFFKIFLSRELAVLVFRAKIVLILIPIMAISLLCMGFGQGTQAYLKYKMDSPFVNFLESKIDYYIARNRDSITSITDKLRNPGFKNEFGIDKIHLFSYTQAQFYQANTSKTLSATIRELSSGDPLFTAVISDDNSISRNDDLIENYKWGIIVTNEFLSKVGYDSAGQSAYLNYDLSINHKSVKVPIPIMAVVRQLPNNCDMCVKAPLFKALTYNYSFNPLDITRPEYEDHYLYDLPDSIMNNMPDHRISANILQGAENNIIQTDSLLPVRMSSYRVYDFDRASPGDSSDQTYPDVLMISTTSLEKVESLRDTLSLLKISLDMSQIESKKNFSIFSRTSDIIIMLLYSLSILSIISINLKFILDHLKANSKNIGTLMAFGLSNSRISAVYTLIGTCIISGSFLIAYILASLVGPWLSNILIDFYNLKISTTSESLFILDASWLHGLVFILIPSALSFLFITFKFRKETPGNLIYER